MDKDIEEIKKKLRAVVVSNPKQVDVRSLTRDYREIVGQPVPYHKYGYKNPVEFLRERFSDCFLFSGAPSNPVLTLIVPDTLKHIDKFVQKQKAPSSGRFGPKRRSVLEDVVNASAGNLITKTFNENRQVGKTEPPIKPIVRNPLPESTPTYGTDIPDLNGNTPALYNDKIFKNRISTDSEPEENHLDNKLSSNAVKNFLKKRLPAYNSSQHLDDDTFIHNGKGLPDDDSGRHTSSSGLSAKAQQLEQLKLQILEIISEAQNGVWCTDLIRLYREKYNHDLNFTRYGYTSIVSLMYSLEGRVAITRQVDTGDWLLQEKTRATPTCATPRPQLRRCLPPTVHTSQRADSEDALPGIDFDPDVFPEDCIQFMESIETPSLNDFRPGAMVAVIVGEVYSPSHFWFIRLGDNYNIAMEDMMDDMTRYYNNEGRERVLARGAVRVGHYCSSVYENDWHRSLIVKIVDSDTVKVRHVDYGTVDTVPAAALKPLLRRWARLPAQALRARLAAVRPSAAGWRWPHAACTAFLRLVANRRLVANVVAVDRRDRVAEVLLIDTSGADDVCIGSELTRLGHADARPDSALRTLDVYLYPRFEALESGDTPNYAEIHAYLRDGIALDYVEAYRRHVPSVLPEPPPAPTPPLAPSPPLSPAVLFEPSLPSCLPEPLQPTTPTSLHPPLQPTLSTSLPLRPASSTGLQVPLQPAASTGLNPPVRSASSIGLPPASEPASSTGLHPPLLIPSSADQQPRVQPAPSTGLPLLMASLPVVTEPATSEPTLVFPPKAIEERASETIESVSTPELTTQIPLLLPETTPKSAPALCQAKPVDSRPAQVAISPKTITLQQLSPDAPVYVPGSPFRPSPPSLLGQRPTGCGVPLRRPPLMSPPHPYPPYPRPMPGFMAGPPLPPPPPYCGSGPTPGVTLSMAECETYRVLSHVNPAAAHWFMVGAMGRAMPVPVPMHSPPGVLQPPPGFST
ncbi:tudor domain-containing protein 5-like [Anticarsia gemmatalis]|uniref:tudor domain-containing protein 5-like n=1 Tax=Anticarsia gemmatalis TaxID=129554 RepID=UPI003F76DA01